MSRIISRLAIAVTAGTAFASNAGAQLLGVAPLPQVSLPLPTANLPVAGPILQNVLAQPGAQQAVNRTLDSVGAGIERIAEAGAPTLLELRRLRLQELIRTNRHSVESDGSGLPVRRGILAVLNPDPAGLKAAQRAGFRIADDQQDVELGLRIVSLASPSGISAKAALRLP